MTCQGFAWWDGDYCCTLKMQILQHAPATNPWLRDEILGVLETPETCGEYMEDPDPSDNLRIYGKLLELRRLQWEYLRQARGESFVGNHG